MGTSGSQPAWKEAGFILAPEQVDMFSRSSKIKF